jgi:hypothetical protein
MGDLDDTVGVMVEGVNRFKLPSHFNIRWIVFLHLDMLGMGIWVHPFTVTLVQVGRQGIEWIMGKWGMGEPE